MLFKTGRHPKLNIILQSLSKTGVGRLRAYARSILIRLIISNKMASLDFRGLYETDGHLDLNVYVKSLFKAGARRAEHIQRLFLGIHLIPSDNTTHFLEPGRLYGTGAQANIANTHVCRGCKS
jgi:hypothetical protein